MITHLLCFFTRNDLFFNREIEQWKGVSQLHTLMDLETQKVC